MKRGIKIILLSMLGSLIFMLIFAAAAYLAITYKGNLVSKVISPVMESDLITSKKSDINSMPEKADLQILQLDCIYEGFSNKFSHHAKYLGLVKNNGEQAATLVKINVDFFDASGRLVGTDSTIVSGFDIPPSQTRSFGDIATDLLSDFDECKARVSSI
ncbi:hypothetical protein HYV49_05745 [Candidatus Pacearchaeota archaeon]|nr:hypothetical protein [Candidatus Pacearchaeota archaeon]